MKLTFFLLLTAILQVSARTNAQTVTYKGTSVPLTSVFSAMKEQTGYLFFYRKEDLAGARPVTLQLDKVPLQSALEKALDGQPLNFAIQGNTIFITLKPAPAPAPAAPETTPEAPPPVISGRVMDSLGNPLSGASVLIKGRKGGTTTDARGDFELKGLPENITLVISFTGYATREYKVKDYNAKFFVVMSRSNSPLDDVQVVAYGTNTRRFNVGSVSVVTAEEIQKQPVTNVLLALQGRVPGLEVTPSSGIPGSTVHTQVRGQNTLISLVGSGSKTTANEPLYIIDGVPIAAQNQNLSILLSSLSGNNYNIPNGGISPLNAINPADIESVSVLKDADATSIYGSLGANGVIVITTKKGKPGATALNIRVNTGPNKITRQMPMLNTQQYLAIRHQALDADGMTADQDPLSFPDLLNFDTTKYTNWSKKYFGGTSNNTDAHVSLSGGSQNTTFIASAGYTRSSYNFPGDFADNRGTLHSGFHHSSLNHRLNIDLGSDFSYDRNNSSSSPSVTSALTLAPDFPDMLDASGKLVWTYNNADISSQQMLAYLKQPFNLQSYNFNNSLRVSYQVITGLTVGVGLGYDFTTTKEYSASPLAAQKPQPGGTASADFVRGDYQSINVEPQIDYRRNIGRGVLTALAGATYRKTVNSNDEIDASGYPDDALLGSVQAATSFTVNDGYTITKYAGAFGRIGYIYDKEFIVSLTGRRDGSSNFGPGHQFGNFGSAGLGWIFSEERFFRKGLPYVSYGKLSGNYGTNGSDGVAPYQYQPFWSVSNTGSTPLFQGVRAYNPANLYNPDYGWASKHSLNLALDLGFLHDRLLVNATWYRNRTGNQLTSYNLPYQTGFSSVVQNLNAKLQDGGVEMTISSVNIKTKNFQWSTSFNISHNNNKLLAFPGLATSSYSSIYAIGKSTSVLYGFKFKGVNDTTGVFQYASGKGGLTSQPSYSLASKGGDQYIIGDGQAKFSGGFGNNFVYKSWSLSFFLQFSKKYAQNYLAGIYSIMPGSMNNLPSELSGFWKNPGDHTKLERLTTGSYYSNALGSAASIAARYLGSSTGGYSDDTYMRLKNVSLSYSLPASAIKKMGMKGFNIYVNAQNLLTFTNYKFGDPESPGIFYTIPFQRIITGGVSLDF
jgi:TonB-linked SusC/RagA family outer membrane protein